MKKDNSLLNVLLVFMGVLIIIVAYWTYIFIENNKQAEYNKCVRILINEDEIANGCDKYFVNDKWYKDFMKQMFDEYNKIK